MKFGRAPATNTAESILVMSRILHAHSDFTGQLRCDGGNTSPSIGTAFRPIIGVMAASVRATGERVRQHLRRLVRRRVVFVTLSRYRNLVTAGIDAVAWATAMLVGAAVRLGGQLDDVFGLAFASVIAVAVGVQLAAGALVGLYRGRWRVASFEEILGVGSVWLLASGVALLENLLLPARPFPLGATIVGSVFAGAAMLAVRGLWRAIVEWGKRPVHAARRVLVFGAGEGATQVVRAMMSDPNSPYLPVALLDDDPGMARRSISGVRVQGDRTRLAEVAARSAAEVLLIAVPSASGSLVRELSKAGLDAGLDVRILPRPHELPTDFGVASITKVTERDLLGRDEVRVDLESIAGYVTGRRVLVTGAGGSIGSELCRQLSSYGPEQLFMLDRDESGLHAVQLSIEGRALLDSDGLIVADIRDRDRMRELFVTLRPHVVFHAAALKHLPLLERHPIEGFKTNVWGTENVLDAAVAAGVRRFVNISTDKAAEPSSVLGATKLIAERLTARAAQETGHSFVSVRFGNVLGSRGSVVPTFQEQIAQGGPVTVTDPEATRFFMTIPEAVRLVIQAGALGTPGDTLILDMGEPVRIVDVARQMIESLNPGVEIVFTGLRPGEKRHEVLVSHGEELSGTRHARIFRTEVQPISQREELTLPVCQGPNGLKAHVIAVATSGSTRTEPHPSPT
jgi:FlaA1/EpsC-like NDP-sugar epimerase